jgi:transmembrane sensor
MPVPKTIDVRFEAGHPSREASPSNHQQALLSHATRDAAGNRSGQSPRQQALEWFVRLRAGDADRATREAFHAWYEARPEHTLAYDRVSGLWQDPAFAEALGAPAPLPARRRLMAAAAAASVLLALAALLAWTGPWRGDYRAATGEQRLVTLSDGSRLTLDTGSAVAVGYSSALRSVRLLRGRVFLDVQPDARRPLRVRAGDAVVQVVGTRFSVRREGGAVTVEVEAGRVAVAAAEGRPPAEITRGQALRAEGGVLIPYAIAVDRAFAWTRGRLVFRDQPLREVLAELDRYYPGSILLLNRTAAATRVSGSYAFDDPVFAAGQLAGVAGARAEPFTSKLLLIR